MPLSTPVFPSHTLLSSTSFPLMRSTEPSTNSLTGWAEKLTARGFTGMSKQTQIIFADDRVLAPQDNLTLPDRLQRAGDFGTRVFSNMMQIEKGSQAQRNVDFLSLLPFMSAAGFFSAGLLAARLDPHEKFTVKFSSMVGKGGIAERLTGSTNQTYLAWEIAAGKLDHDTPASGGIVNFRFMHINAQDGPRITQLKSLGHRLRQDWQTDIMRLMQAGNGEFAKRSGQADASAVRAILSSLQSSPQWQKSLSQKAQRAITRTQERDGQVIIPNLYGYPFSGYAFIPYKPYQGNYQQRPNQGVMLNLRRGTLSEIRGDTAFAGWAKLNRNDLLQSLNARDRQGGMDAHWPAAGKVLDDLIAGRKVTLEGYNNFFSDRAIPIREVFNYAAARASDYQLKYGSLDSSNNPVATHFSAMNKKNLLWNDQTSVFSDTAQRWKAASEFWDNTFGFLPVIGNLGGIVFGAHNGLFGMMATDRIGGNAGAIIAGLQLVAETAQGIEGATTEAFEWKFSQSRQELHFSDAGENIPSENPVAMKAGQTQQSNIIPGTGISEIPLPSRSVKIDFSHPLLLGVVEKSIPESSVMKSPFAAWINGRWSALMFDPEKYSWFEMSTGDYLAFNQDTQRMEKTAIPVPANEKQRSISMKLFKIDRWPELPDVTGVSAEPQARVVPRNIEQIWIGSIDKLIAQKTTINANARMAETNRFTFNLHVLPEESANDVIQQAKRHFPAANMIDMRISPEFQRFRKSKYHQVFKPLIAGKDANRAAATDIYRFWLLNSKGGCYLDIDDRLKPGFFFNIMRTAPDNILPSAIVSLETLSMDGAINSNFFGAHAGSQLLQEILETGYLRWQLNPDIYRNRPRISPKTPYTKDMKQAMKIYMSNVSRTWGPTTLSDLFFRRNPDYLRFKASLDIIFHLSQRGITSPQWVAWIRNYDNALFGPSNQIQMGSMHSWEHSR